MPKTILVIGAGGFIGGEIARLLATQPDLSVRGGTRDARPLGGSITPCRVDVRDDASLAAALAGADAVVDCAIGDRATMVGGTEKLLQAARAAGVRRVVYLSSTAVYGYAEGVLTESAPRVPANGEGYAAWKSAAEEVCEAAGRDGQSVAILRPAIVYGPASAMWTTQPAQRLLTGAWGSLGEQGRGSCNLVHVHDVATCCLAALRCETLVGCEAFNVTGPTTVTWQAYYERLRVALGLPPMAALPAAAWRRRRITALPAKAVARVLPRARWLFARQILLAPGQSEWSAFALRATYPSDKAATRLGWQPSMSLDDGLADIVAWLRACGIAPAGRQARAA